MHSVPVASSLTWAGMGQLAILILLTIAIAAMAARGGVLRMVILGIVALVVLGFAARFFGEHVPQHLLVREQAAGTAEPGSDWRQRVEKAMAVVASAANEPVTTANHEPPPKPKSPPWADAPPGLVDGVYRMVVAVGPYKSWEECEGALDQKLREGVEQYVETFAEREPDLDPRTAARVHLPLDYVHNSIVKDFHCERIVSRTPAIGSMIQLKVLLGFDRQANVRIQEAARSVIVADRLRWSGLGLAGVLLSLLAAYAYLKTDLATHGAYRGRLRLAAIMTILGVCAAAVLAAAT